MGIEEIVDVQISIEDTAVTRAGFGVGLIIGSSGRLSSRVEEFANATAVAAVFTAGDPELNAANKYFGQEIKPEKVFIAQRDADVKQKIKITIPVLQNDTDYTITLAIDGAVGILVTFTSDADATREEIVDGLIADLAVKFPDSEFSTTDNVENFDIEISVAGDPFSATLSVNLTKATITANINIETELALIEQANNEWYALLSVSHVDKDIKRAANFIQSRRRIYVTSSQNADIISPEAHILTIDFDADFVTGNVIDLTIDGIPVAQTAFDTNQSTTINALATNILAHTSVDTATVTDTNQITVTALPLDVLLVITALAVTSGASQAVGTVTTIQDPTTDLGSELKALSLDRTALMFTKNADTEFPEAAWAGGLLPFDPGSVTWFAKTLAGITVDELTASEKSKALGNNVNTYTPIGGVNITQNATMSSGRFIDIRRGVDWLQARMEEGIFFQIVNLPKIPYSDDGVAIIENEIVFVLNDGVDKNVLASDPEPTITVPKVLSISANDRVARLLPDVKWTANLAGALHKVQVRGTVSV